MTKLSISAIVFAVSLFLSTISFGANACKQIQNFGVLPLYFSDAPGKSVESCDELEKIMSPDEIEKVLTINDCPKKLTIQSCNDLKEFNIGQSLKVEDLKTRLGLAIENWCSADFDYFTTQLLNCNDKNLKSTVLDRVADLKREHKEIKITSAIRAAKIKFDAATELEEKNKKEAFLAATEKKYSSAGVENGWKNLKWGMTLAEIQAMYVSENGEKCAIAKLENVVESPFRFPEKFIELDTDRGELSERFKEVFCGEEYRPLTMVPKIFMFDGKFFGKTVGLPDYLNEKGKKDFESVMQQLKEKFPKGKIHQREALAPQNLSGKSMKYKYPSFEYISDNIKVWSDERRIYFFEPKMMNEVLSIPKKEKQKKDEQEKKKIKGLF